MSKIREKCSLLWLIAVSTKYSIYTMVLIIAGNYDHAAHALRKVGRFGEEIYLICDCSHSNKKKRLKQIKTEIFPQVRT